MLIKGYYDDAQEVFIPEPIFKALAGTNYSIALSVNGNLYEWGMYLYIYTRSKLGEPILTPRQLSIMNKKYLDIKGYENVFVGLTSANELFCWGKGVERYTNNIVPENIYLVPK